MTGGSGSRLLAEFPPMLRLAGPLVLAELGWMSMGIVDTIMVGRLGAAAIGGVGLGSILFYTVAMFGSGLLLGLDTLVAQAFGAGRIEDCHQSLIQSVYLCLFLTPVLMGVLWAVALLLPVFGIHPSIQAEAVPYMRAMMWSTLPQLFYFGLRRYLQGMNLVGVVMFALLTANLVNALFNWILIFGHWGAPALGAAGAGWATMLAKIYMTALLLAYILYYNRRYATGLFQVPFAFNLGRVRELIALGLPAALQMMIEIGVFATATALIGKLTPAALAAHQIALHAASTTFMVPMGISSAAAVRVGQALGRRDPEAAARAGWAALLLGAAFMSCAGVSFVTAPRAITSVFTLDPAVTAIAVALLAIAALFQLFDGLQIVATGALRGAGDTRTPMLCHLAGYWLIGLPVGYFLCFYRNWQAAGLWAGLCLALILIGIVLFAAWRRAIHRLTLAQGNKKGRAEARPSPS